MATTSLDLFRSGNTTSARLDYVRPGKDVIVFQKSGVDWVQGRSGGVSTFDAAGSGTGRWWRLPSGTSYDGTLLYVWNDHANHWSWEPEHDMPLSDYEAALRAVNGKFIYP